MYDGLSRLISVLTWYLTAIRESGNEYGQATVIGDGKKF